MISEDGRKSLDSEFAARSRIRIDARKWMLSKLQPEKYGDKMDYTSGGEKIQFPGMLKNDPVNE